MTEAERKRKAKGKAKAKAEAKTGAKAKQEPQAKQEPRQPSEEELRARLEEELQRIQVSDVLLQTLVSLVNLGFQRLGLTAKDEQAAAKQRDLGQARLAIEAVRALLPVLEAEAADEVRPVREALSQLQLAYVKAAGAAEGGGEGPEPEGRDGEQEQEPQARASGRLWTPPGSAG